MNKKLAIGLGSGRCGTVSLRDLLIHQGFDAIHELKLMPWAPNYSLCDEILNEVFRRNDNSVSDIGYYYLNYVEYIIKEYPTVKCICLKRDKWEVIRSFLKFSSNNYFSKPIDREENEWDQTFPTYDNVSKTDGLSLYWNEYYKTAEPLVEKFPNNIQIFDMNEVFNTKKGQKKLFEFLRIEGNIKLGIKRHTNHPNKPYKFI
jgi:hypothetical protein